MLHELGLVNSKYTALVRISVLMTKYRTNQLYYISVCEGKGQQILVVFVFNTCENHAQSCV